ncbi:MAG: hypothetical protein QOJ19_1700 [Acidimicrobiia bacterium]|nr:hypothetical protein [Acidimicrobiia bacterium]
MEHSMPPVIAQYLSASDHKNIDVIVASFTDDAVVRDEDKEWQGHAGIRQWRSRVANAYQYTVELRGVVAIDGDDGLDRHDVYSHLEGNFPGGQVDLVNRFGLRDGRIASLEIVPAPPPA